MLLVRNDIYFLFFVKPPLLALYGFTFFATPFGWATNCFPFLFPAALALLVAAFSPGLKAFQALSGKYLFLPLEGDPSEVLHFC